MARTPPSRVSSQRVLGDLRLASRKGDRAALSLALDQMRLVIKQGERIAHQKGWKLSRPAPAAAGASGKTKKRPAPGRRRRGAPAPSTQPSLFE
jgi:hypothetical protein